MRTYKLALGMSVLSLVLLAACSTEKTESTTQNEPNEKKPAVELQPMKLRVYDGLFLEDEFQKLVTQTVQQKYPNITVERINKKSANPHLDLQEIVASGEKVDIIFAPIFHYQLLKDIGVIEDMTNPLKQKAVDLSPLNKNLYNYLTSMGEGKIVALPLYRNIQVNLYNKTLFNKFGVPYPTDNMTYDQVIELAKKLTATDAGTPYYGFFPGNPVGQLGQLSQNFLDKTTNESFVTNENFVKVMRLHKSIFDIPGNTFVPVAKGQENFYKNHNLAMLIEWISAVNGQVPDNLDWDMVTMPEFKDRPGVHSKIDFHAAYVSTMAKEKATAAEVIAFLATSETVQRRMAENAKVPVIDRPDILQQYGTGKMKGKHIEVLQKTVMAPIPPFSAYENQWPFTGAPLINLAYNPVMQGQKDVNTGLRDADEAIKNLFKAEKAK